MLWFSSLFSNVECIKLLQSSGADFNKKDKRGRYVNTETHLKKNRNLAGKDERPPQSGYHVFHEQ